MNVEEQRVLDEASTAWNDMMPPSLWTFFGNLQREGFSATEAMRLTEVWLSSLVTGQSQPRRDNHEN